VVRFSYVDAVRVRTESKLNQRPFVAVLEGEGMKDGKPETVAEAIADTMKTGRRWGLRGFPGLTLGTPEDWRNHCMQSIRHWKNSDLFIRSIEAEWDKHWGDRK
jgi:transposase